MSTTITVKKKRSNQIPGARGSQGLPGDNPPVGPQGINPQGIEGDIGNPGPTCACRLDQDIPEISPTGPKDQGDYLTYNQSNQKWQPTQPTANSIDLNNIDFSNIQNFMAPIEALSSLGQYKLYRQFNDPRIKMTKINFLGVTDELKVYYRADNVDGMGITGSGSTTTLVNLANPGTYNGTIVPGTAGGGGIEQDVSQLGTPFEYGVKLVADGNKTKLDTGDSYIELNNWLFPSLINSTYELWFKCDSFDSEGNGIFYAEMPEPYTTHQFRHLFYLSSPTLLRYAQNPTFSPVNALFVQGEYQQLVFTVDGSKGVKIYKNGSQIAAGTTTDYSGGTLTNAVIGHFRSVTGGGGGSGITGKVNIVRLYNKALTATEVLQNYQAEYA